MSGARCDKMRAHALPKAADVNKNAFPGAMMVRIKEDVLRTRMKGWEWFLRKGPRPHTITGKYLFFSPDRDALANIALDEIVNCGFTTAKISLEETNIGPDYVLCLYDCNAGRRYELARKYRGRRGIEYRYWKSDEATRAGIYSDTYVDRVRSDLASDVAAAWPNFRRETSILPRTFIHAEQIGAKTERMLWQSGIGTWDDFLAADKNGRNPLPHLAGLTTTIRQSKEALRRQDISYFANRLPSGEQWRLLSEFWDSAAFIDTETTGLRSSSDKITVIGLYDSRSFSVFVRGKNINQFPSLASRFPLLVSFGGSVPELT